MVEFFIGAERLGREGSFANIIVSSFPQVRAAFDFAFFKSPDSREEVGELQHV